MNKRILFLMILLILPASYAQTSVLEQLNYFSRENNLDFVFSFENASHAAYTTITDNFLRIDKEGKTLALKLDSFKQNRNKIKGFRNEFQPKNIVISAEDYPKITFSEDEEIFSITQIGEGKTEIFFGEQANDNQGRPSVFVIEHYDPEREISDASREEGNPRLAIITKNNPHVIINNNGISVIADSGVIGRRTFFSTDLGKAQIDILDKDKANEIIGFADYLLIRISVFNFNTVFDRGYSTEQINKVSEKKIRGFEVTPDLCSKLGFVFLPGYGYDSLKESRRFTGNSGWVLGIAYSKDNNFNTSLDDMMTFLEKAYENNLTPIVRIDGENLDPAIASDFLNRLYNASEGKLEYVQIGDKPNSRVISYGDYAQLVSEVRENVDFNISIISAGLLPEKDAEKYLEGLLRYPDFIESIDYMGAYAYNMSLNGKDCFDADEIYEDTICKDDFTNYKMLLETLRRETGKEFEVIITEAGYPPQEENFWRTHQLLQSFKEDRNVKAALVYSANSWKDSPDKAWLNEDSGMNGFAEKISSQICR